MKKYLLKEFFKNQVELEFKSQTEKISELLIDYIEPSGWITISIEELANFSGFDKTLIEKILLKNAEF